ncbi:hypothetical protein FQR65_LT06702 [Abscondita terminalis]|nr:hypothetical protein FQR65_LT06702 [Abscondita terminalis]
MNAAWIIVTIIILILLLLAFFKVYLVLTTGWDRSPTCLLGKTTLITGANTEIKATEPRLDILVNNAGAGLFKHTITQDDLSLSMQINHFGPFLLTILFIGLLKRSFPSRIVMVSSEAARMGKLNISDLNSVPTRYFKEETDYANTKLCNIITANELARRLKGTGVDVNSVHPGAVQSDFLRNLSPFKQRIAKFFTKLFYKPTEAGAQTTIYVAVSKEISGVSGAYFADCKEKPMLQNANNIELAKLVWEKSEQFVKLTAEEKKF